MYSAFTWFDYTLHIYHILYLDELLIIRAWPQTYLFIFFEIVKRLYRKSKQMVYLQPDWLYCAKKINLVIEIFVVIVHRTLAYIFFFFFEALKIQAKVKRKVQRIKLNENSLRYYSLHKELFNKQRLLIPDTKQNTSQCQST